MFGKGKRAKSANDVFVTAAGVKAGNLKGRGTAEKTAPVSKGSSLGLDERYTKERPLSKGKAGPVKIT